MNEFQKYSQGKMKQCGEHFLKTGVGFGSVLAIVISFNTYGSVGWAILHGILNWLYVFYYLIFVQLL